MSSPSPKDVNPTDLGVLDAIRQRWSPYRFEDRWVEDEKVVRCLEAARWTASSYNDQPWSWIVARRQDTEPFQTMLSCLLEANQAWASQSGVLLISVIRTTFRKNQKPNRVALHDLGQAAAHLALQATQIGLQVHQMAGLNLSRVRQIYEIPDSHQPQTAIAIGYPDRSAPVTEVDRELQQRETRARERMPLRDQVFSSKWGNTSSILK
ncbi:nitroreductase family protein [Novipirellula artificiosorum]|uniref:Malonic semialdehyde reductase n=1 Tax=Novipirellula artificiosorum TaxID=2528016 RepID=A0A5C6E0U6_9BACT|nr:nitroreductase family protein [Novipirellula artificiosorum]TWU42480.1 malonic semialdehyde reductase [Novipirellula artificiosorum]